MTEYLTLELKWKPGYEEEHCFANTSRGCYSIRRQAKRRFTLRLEGAIIGIASDIPLLRRLAETDYKQRTGQTDDN